MRIRVLALADQGPLLAELLSPLGDVIGPTVLTSEVNPIKAAVGEALAKRFDLIVTTGATGVGPRDVAVDAVGSMLERELPGVVEALRSRHSGPSRALFRGAAGVTWSSLIVTLPGNAIDLQQCVPVLLELAPLVLKELSG